MNKLEKTIVPSYAADLLEAETNAASADRRGFLIGASRASMAALLGGAIPFHRNMPEGLIPVALSQEMSLFDDKEGLVILNDRPVNAECPPHLLDDDVTPTARHFVRNNGTPPTSNDAAGWRLTIDGEVSTPLIFSIDELKKKFEIVRLQLQIECGGNGRAYFEPKAKGNQWTVGAVACSEWTGVRLADVLDAAGLKSSGVYTAHYGADTHLSGNPDKEAISRGVPISKAMSRYNLIAFEQNRRPLHPMNGAPLRLVIPGWPGSCSHKWLTRIRVRDRVHDGEKMTGTAYRIPAHPVAPGEKVPEEDFRIIESMPVKSLITFPESGAQLTGSREMKVRGHAWAGDEVVTALDVSIDFGATWLKADLRSPANPFAWQQFSASVKFPSQGYYEVWARATDDKGRQQPFGVSWNPKGYLNNSMHRVAVRVA